jgi:2-phosphosulfolactate phosphatase
MKNSIIIDCFFNDKKKYSSDYTIVAVDVIRTTTTAITSVACGRRCFPAASLEMALSISHSLKNPLLGGELGGNMPFGFEIQNSPSQLMKRFDIERPLILLSTSGTRLIQIYSDTEKVYLGSLRNYKALINHLALHHSNIALIGAGTREEFREEDQLCCSWIAKGLIENSFIPENNETEEIIRRWENCSEDIITTGKSAEYLRSSGQEEDLQFILNHINDLDNVYKLVNDEVIEIPPDYK